MNNTKLTQDLPEGTDHREIDPKTGMQKAYLVLTEEERAKGFVRPYRTSYIHKPCGTLTKMSRDISETYARNPYFYSGTFCVGCGKHFDLEEFHWDGTDGVVGS